MTPVVYQNHGGTESLWADSTVCTDGTARVRRVFAGINSMLPAAISPLLLLQQQTWTNANDGLWRWMPSIAVDQSGNTVIGYSTSSTTIFPAIRYAGRLAADPPGNLAQGEAVMFAGVGFHSGVRWGDYTRTEVDPSNGMDFWHINQYAQSGTLAHAHRQVQFRRRRWFSNSYSNRHTDGDSELAAPGLPVRTCLPP